MKVMSKWLGRCLLVGMVLALILSTYDAKAAPEVKAEDFYKGATVAFIVPNAPGGMFDLWARTLAPHLKKYTGAKAFVVNNMAGAGGISGGGYLYNAAKRDGLTIGFIPFAGMVTGEVLGFAPVKYQMANFNYIGRVEATCNVLLVSPASGFKTFQDMQKTQKKIRFGTSDPTNISSILGSILIEAFGLNAKIVSGFKGSRDMKLALSVGKELDARTFTLDASDVVSIKSGELVIVSSVSKIRHPQFPQVPTALETPGLSDQSRKLLTLGATLQENVYVITAPPGTPEDRVAFLEKALSASLKEPALLDWAGKQSIAVTYHSGKQLKSSVNDLMNLIPPAERPMYKHMLLEKYF